MRYPVAKVLPGADDTTPVTIESSGPQSMEGDKYILDGDVVVTYGDRKVAADHIEYDKVTGEVTATGHLKVTGGPNNEIITASHGTLNTKTQTGRFYDVSGSVGLKQSANKLVYANSNPFLFTGKVVVKTGPQAYEVYDGTVTSCQLPHPDWQLFAKKFTVDEEKARGTNSVFQADEYAGVVYALCDASGGCFGPAERDIASGDWGVFDEGAGAGRADLLGDQSQHGYDGGGAVLLAARMGEAATFRYKGLGNDFLTAHYSGLQDRGYCDGRAVCEPGWAGCGVVGAEGFFAGGWCGEDEGGDGPGVSELVSVSRGVYGELQPGGVDGHPFDCVWRRMSRTGMRWRRGRTGTRG